MNAINRAGNSSKLKKRSWAQQRSPHISEDDDNDNDNDNDNDDDYCQPNSSIVIRPPPIPVPPIPVPAFRPTTSIDVSIFALSEVPKDMGLDNTVNEKTREIAQFICRIEAIPGGIYGLDTGIVNNLSINCKEYNREKKKVCILHF